MKFNLNKNKQPLAYYAFWAIFIAICMGLVWCAWQNILPYQEVIRIIFRIPQDEPVKIVQLLWFRAQLSLSWVVGAIFWAILQGVQVSHLLITQSEKALEFLIQKANSKNIYEERDKDNPDLLFAKRRYNSLPLATLTYLKMGCIIAYVIEFFVNLNSFPIVDGNFMDILIVFLLFQWDKIRGDNLAMILLTLFAVEWLIFAAIMVYRIIEVFKESGAYRAKNKQV